MTVRCGVNVHGFWLPLVLLINFAAPDAKNISVYHLRFRHGLELDEPIVTRRSDGILPSMQRLFDLHTTTLQQALRFRCALVELLGLLRRRP